MHNQYDNKYNNSNIQLGIIGLLKDTMTKGAQGLEIQINHEMYKCMCVHEQLRVCVTVTVNAYITLPHPN